MFIIEDSLAPSYRRPSLPQHLGCDDVHSTHGHIQLLLQLLKMGLHGVIRRMVLLVKLLHLSLIPSTYVKGKLCL